MEEIKCLDDELYDIYIEDGKQVIESLREIYEKGKRDALKPIAKMVEEWVSSRDCEEYNLPSKISHYIYEQTK